jgi:LacI family transcriptional regulator
MTIKDIARECGVGISTVSRVLNNRPDVSEEVRKKVLAAVEASGYIPNNSARDLVRSRSDTIGVVVRGTGNFFFTDMLKTMSREIDSSGYDMVLRFIATNEDEVKAGAILEREKKLRGLLFLGGRFNYTASEMSLIGVPYVCCSYTNSFGSLRESDFSSVSIDDFNTAYDAVSVLIAAGHRRIAAFFDFCDDHSISELRYGGYCAALKDHGIEYDPALVVQTGGFGMEDAYEGMEKLLRAGTPFTAAFVESDMMAIAAVKALRSNGKKVPDDCSVIAIDGLKLSEYMSPTLTTMVQPCEEIGRESVRILIRMISDPSYYRHLRPEATLRQGHSVSSL